MDGLQGGIFRPNDRGPAKGHKKQLYYIIIIKKSNPERAAKLFEKKEGSGAIVYTFHKKRSRGRSARVFVSYQCRNYSSA
ncbi:MAG: hypothetical protein II503_06010, partial [Clostridia bacterium]|nr:hypothetical protein [Clostridia bacterium]